MGIAKHSSHFGFERALSPAFQLLIAHFRIRNTHSCGTKHLISFLLSQTLNDFSISIKLAQKGTELTSKIPDFKKGQIIDSHADVALQFIPQHGSVEYSQSEATKVRWKIDLHLMPIVNTLELLPIWSQLIIQNTALDNLLCIIPRQSDYLVRSSIQYKE